MDTSGTYFKLYIELPEVSVLHSESVYKGRWKIFLWAFWEIIYLKEAKYEKKQKDALLIFPQNIELFGLLSLNILRIRWQ